MWTPLLLLLACRGADPVAPTGPTCPEAQPSPCASLGLDEWEIETVRPTAESLRAGVVPLGADGFGVCRGRTRCEEFLGASPGELPEGDYVIRAVLDVPPLGTGWKARFETACETVSAAGRTRDRSHERTYELRATGPRGHQIEPLWRIRSPLPEGARECAFRLVPIRPDGKEGTAMEGAYRTPAPPLTDR